MEFHHDSPSEYGKQRVLVTEKAAVVRAHLKPGEEVPAHESHAHVVVTCVKGSVLFRDGNGKGEVLSAGSLVYMEPHEVHALHANEDSELVIVHF